MVFCGLHSDSYTRFIHFKKKEISLVNMRGYVLLSRSVNMVTNLSSKSSLMGVLKGEPSL